MRQGLLKVAFSAAVLIAPSAQAALMTFGYGAPVVGQGYTENGLTLSAIAGAVPGAERIRDWKTSVMGADPEFAVSGGYGEREFLFAESAQQVSFSSANGGWFDLLAFDVEDPAGLNPWSSGGSFTLQASNGYRRDVPAYTYVPALWAQGGDGVIRFEMDGGMEKITWFSISCSACQVTLDNIEFKAVSEPRSLYLFSIGVLLAAVFVRKTIRND
jgi:hypothetical protein